MLPKELHSFIPCQHETLMIIGRKRKPDWNGPNFSILSTQKKPPGTAEPASIYNKII